MVDRKKTKKTAGKKAGKKASARTAGIRERLARREEEIAEKERAFEAKENEIVRVSEGLSADLERTKKELQKTQSQISNQIKTAALEHYAKTRERNSELPHWSKLAEEDQILWQKFTLKLEGLKKERQELIQKNTLKYGRYMMALEAGELEEPNDGPQAFDI